MRENRSAPDESAKLPSTLSDAVRTARESAFVKEVLPEALICTYLDLQEQVIAEAIRNVGDYREKLFRLA